MGPLRPHQASDHVAGYLARGENVVLEMKQHWARVLPAIMSCTLGLVLVIVAGIFAPAWMGPLTNAAWWIWLVLAAHLLWRLLEWWRETFVITNKRLILVHGLFVKRVAMMLLSKVTDMSYNRSPVARLLGYGTFKIESAGQDQALDVIDFVRNPNEKYRDICGLIFGFEDEDDVAHRGRRGAASERAATNDDERFGDDEFDDAFDDVGRDGPRRTDSRDEPFDHDAHDHDDPFDTATADGPTRPMAVRAPRARYGRGRRPFDVDDTDPHGFVTVGHPMPRSDTHHTYRQPHDVADPPPEPGDEPSWWVSREHATSPQPVHRPNRAHDVDRGSTWRDGT